jgi:hypothetical protein
MSFTATINSIAPQDDGSGLGELVFIVAVTFADSASGFTTNKTYSFPKTITQPAAVAQITADGLAFKTHLGAVSNLATKVGSVITI